MNPNPLPSFPRSPYDVMFRRNRSEAFDSGNKMSRLTRYQESLPEIA